MISNEDFQIIKNLTEIQACSGNESRIREYIKELIEPHCDKIETDVLGNLRGIIVGEQGDKENNLKVLIDAHMDE